MPRSAKPTLCNLQQGINQINFEIEELLKESVQDNGDKIEDNTWSTRISIDSGPKRHVQKNMLYSLGSTFRGQEAKSYFLFLNKNKIEFVHYW